MFLSLSSVSLLPLSSLVLISALSLSLLTVSSPISLLICPFIGMNKLRVRGLGISDRCCRRFLSNSSKQRSIEWLAYAILDPNLQIRRLGKTLRCAWRGMSRIFFDSPWVASLDFHCCNLIRRWPPISRTEWSKGEIGSIEPSVTVASLQICWNCGNSAFEYQIVVYKNYSVEC